PFCLTSSTTLPWACLTSSRSPTRPCSRSTRLPSPPRLRPEPASSSAAVWPVESQAPGMALPTSGSSGRMPGWTSCWRVCRRQSSCCASPSLIPPSLPPSWGHSTRHTCTRTLLQCYKGRCPPPCTTRPGAALLRPVRFWHKPRQDLLRTLCALTCPSCSAVTYSTETILAPCCARTWNCHGPNHP